MSRAVIPEHKFDKKEFARLLMEAKGARTQADFAHDCNISLSHISRYLNKKKESPPTPATIYQISRAAKNGVTSDALLTAAGYDPEKHTASRSGGRQEGEVVNKAKLLVPIVSSLATCKFTWSTLPPENLVLSNNAGRTAFDFGLAINDDKELLKNWYFTFRDLPGDNWDVHYLQTLYGMYSTFPFKPDIKLSIVVSKKEEADFIISCPPLLFPIYCSVILIDSITGQISEDYLQTAREIPDQLNKIYRLS